MSTSEMPPAPGPAPRSATSPSPTLWHKDASGWTGWVTFAAIMAITMGAYQAIMGLVAIFNDKYYLVGKSGLVVELDYTVWGWVHLIVGLAAVAGGLALMQGRNWGRMVVIGLAGLSALLNLGFLSAYPIWSVILIALDVIIIYALTVHWDEVRA
ncbi:MAG: hypothetical protein ACJ73E_18035 [Mycobacteriales bacterium]